MYNFGNDFRNKSKFRKIVRKFFRKFVPGAVLTHLKEFTSTIKRKKKENTPSAYKNTMKSIRQKYAITNQL